MDEAFNPYYAFLGLDEELTSPNFYQLLRLREQEQDLGKIQTAADKASTRVRSHRPGEHAAQWSQLLDEIDAARGCLTDADRRQIYDQKLGRQSATATSSQPPNPAAYAPAMTFVPPPQQSFAYPPGMGPAPSYGATANPQPGYGHPSLPPGAWAPAQSPADPMAPVSVPATPGPMSPVAYTWSTTPPAGTTLAPPVVHSEPNALDPMAPVAFPGRSEPSTEARPRIVGFAGGASLPGTDPHIPFATPAVATSPQSAVAVSVAQVAEVSALETMGLPTKAPSARPIAKRPARFPLPLLLGAGGGVALLAGLLIAWGMNGGSRPEKEPLAVNDQTKTVHRQPQEPKPEQTPQPVAENPVLPEPKPERREPDPMPQPELVRPTIEPEPIKPEMKPEPDPVKPAPKPMPTAAELAELSRLMKEAKTALGDFSFDEADAALEQAERAAKLPEHQAVVSRLKTVADMARRFRRAIQEAMARLDAGEVIKVGTSTEAAIVEASPDKLVIRVAGQNRTYTLDDMPLGLAVNIGERALSTDDPKTRVFKGAYVFVDKRTDAAQLQKVKTWWEEAQASGVDVSNLLPVLTDSYDFAAPPSEE